MCEMRRLMYIGAGELVAVQVQDSPKRNGTVERANAVMGG
jgi:hypothetical protein